MCSNLAYLAVAVNHCGSLICTKKNPAKAGFSTTDLKGLKGWCRFINLFLGQKADVSLLFGNLC